MLLTRSPVPVYQCRNRFTRLPGHLSGDIDPPVIGQKIENRQMAQAVTSDSGRKEREEQNHAPLFDVRVFIVLSG